MELTLQFKKPVEITAGELCELLPRVFHDVTGAKIDFDPRQDVIKTLVLTCDRCSPDGVLAFIRVLSKEKIQVLKGLYDMSEQANNQPTEQANVDVNKTCNDLGQAFQLLFGQTGGVAAGIQVLQETVKAQGEQIAALQKIIDGTPANPQTKEPAKAGLKDAISAIQENAKTQIQTAKTELNDTAAAKITELETAVNGKIAEIDGKVARIDALEKSCKGMENHLASLPLFERILKDDIEQPAVAKARPKGT